MTDRTMGSSASLALIPWLVAIRLTGCRGEGDGAPVAQLRAQDRLAAATTDATTDPRPQLTLRRLWAGDYVEFCASSISSDGRYLSMIDWATSNLAVRDLSAMASNEEGGPR